MGCDMGSFNVQCMVSKNDIFNGDEIVVFPLFRNYDYSSDSDFKMIVNSKKEYDGLSEEKKSFFMNYRKEWVDGLKDNTEVILSRKSQVDWQIGLPIFARYNDYGGFEFDGDEINQLGVDVLLGTIKKRGVEVSEDSYRNCRNIFDPKLIGSDKKKDISKIMSLVADNDLLLCKMAYSGVDTKINNRNYTVMSFAFMDREVYDLMFKNMGRYLEKIEAEKIVYMKSVDDVIRFHTTDSKKYERENNKIKKLLSFKDDNRFFYEDAMFDVLSHVTINRDKGGKFESHYLSEDSRVKLHNLLDLKGLALATNYFMDNIVEQRWEPVKYNMGNGSGFRYYFNKGLNDILMKKHLERIDVEPSNFDPMNREEVLSAVENYASVLSFVDNSLLKDRSFALEAVKLNGNAIKYLNLFKDDIEVVRYAIEESSGAFEYISERLRNDKEFVFDAIKKADYLSSYIGSKLKFELLELSEDPLDALNIMMSAKDLDDNINSTTKVGKKNKM